MTSATVARWARAFVVTGVVFFVVWHAAVATGVTRPATVVLGLYGFVFSVVFGKAYALVPSYFARELAFPRAPAVHLPLSIAGVLGLVADAVGAPIPASGVVGASCWFGGVLVFFGTLGWTVRDNVTGRETGTGEANAHRRRVDRAANGFVPVALAYLLVGAAIPVLETVATDPTPLPFASGPPKTHVLAAGSATLLVFAIGFRLLSRMLVATPRPALVAVVLPAGAVGPALLAGDFLGGVAFRAGAALQALAVTGFAVAYADMYRRSDRSRVGFHGVLAGAFAGVAAVTLGLSVAFVGVDSGVIEAHYRLALGGFLGLTIVGVTYQFYPPAIGSTPGVDDRTALVAIALLFVGAFIEAAGYVGDASVAVTLGSLAALAGAIAYAFVVLALFVERSSRAT